MLVLSKPEVGDVTDLKLVKIRSVGLLVLLRLLTPRLSIHSKGNVRSSMWLVQVGAIRSDGECFPVDCTSLGNGIEIPLNQCQTSHHRDVHLEGKVFFCEIQGRIYET